MANLELLRRSGLSRLPRNAIFRERVITIQLEVDGQIQSEFELVEANSVKVSSAGATAVMPGVVAAVLQPWYFQPVVIEITGKSYMGAFADNSLNLAADFDVGRLIDMREKINQAFYLLRSSISGMQVRLTIGDRKNKEETRQQDRFDFVGFFDDISIEETQDSPYMQSYSLKFTGEYANLFDVDRGAKGTQTDANNNAKAAASSVGNTKPPGLIEKVNRKNLRFQEGVSPSIAGQMQT